jgi:hypothetical protein
MRIVAFILGLFLLGVVPAAAQFDQASYAGTGAGSANAQTITLPNATQYTDLLGVLVKYIPGATNTAAATLAVSGNGGALSGGPIAFRKPSGAGLIALTGNELITGQPVWIMYDGTYFDILSVTTSTVTAANLANSSLGFSVPVNLQLNASVGSNQLTIAVKGNNGSDPSATNPVIFSFRDTTIANGDPVIVTLSAALSFTIGSGDTMGCVSNQMCRLWVLAFNNAGTVQLCAFNALSGTSVAPINEGVLQTSQSGTSGGSSAQLYYCNASAVTNKAARILGYVEISESTAGTWATGPTYVQLFGPGVKKPGDVVQRIFSTNSTSYSATTSYAAATNFSQAITPTSAANPIFVHAEANYQTTANDGSNAQIGRTSCSNLVGNNAVLSGITAVIGMAPMSAIDSPNTTSSVTYVLCLKASVNGATALNNNAGNISSMSVEEIMGALEPANDDKPLRMVG